MTKRINKDVNLLKILQLPSSPRIDKDARKLMGKYAKQPDKFLNDVNKLLKMEMKK